MKQQQQKTCRKFKMDVCIISSTTTIGCAIQYEEPIDELLRIALLLRIVRARERVL